jgi:hypothetical protein
MKLFRSTVPMLALAACATAAPEGGPGAAPAAQTGAARTTAGAPNIDPARLAEHVRTLASDEFLGRGPATPGEEKTVAYIAQQFQAAGLQPGGPNGSWFQEVPLLMSDIVGTPELSLAVGGRRQSLTQGEQIAVRSSHAQPGPRRHPRRAARLPGLRGAGEGAELGRLQGREPARQGGDRPDQRPGLRDGAGRLRRQGDDVLRPLDLQVRGGRAAGARRAADRARDGARRRTGGPRSRTPTPTRCSTSCAPTPRRCTRRWRRGSSATWRWS